MRGWISRAGRTTKRVFVTAVITMLLLMWVALDMPWAGGTWELPTWANESLGILWLVVTIPPIVATEAFWDASDVASDFPIMYGALLFMLAYWMLLATLIALLLAGVIVAANVAIRRLHDRSAASKEA